MRLFKIALCALVVAGSSVSYAAPAETLDGRRFRVTLTNVKNQKSWRHRLVFKRGKFESLECRQYGFKKAAYELDGTTFSASPASRKGGTVVWKGKLDGDSVEGTMEWTRPGAEQAIRYTFKGKVVGKKKPKPE
jgi:hypothetical protein